MGAPASMVSQGEDTRGVDYEQFTIEHIGHQKAA